MSQEGVCLSVCLRLISGSFIAMGEGGLLVVSGVRSRDGGVIDR